MWSLFWVVQDEAYHRWKITTFILGYPDFDGDLRWSMFPLCSPKMAWISFEMLPCIKKNFDANARFHIVETARVARNASFQTLLQEKTCNSAHEQTPLSTDNIDLFLRHWERFRAKDISGAPRISNFHTERRAKMICANCHCENNKTFLLINTTFPPSTTSVDKIFCNWKGKKRNKISASAKLTKRWIQTRRK